MYVQQQPTTYVVEQQRSGVGAGFVAGMVGGALLEGALGGHVSVPREA